MVIMPPIYNLSFRPQVTLGLRRPESSPLFLRRPLLAVAPRPSRFARPAEIKIRVRPDTLDINAESIGDVLTHTVRSDVALDDVVNKLLLRAQLTRKFGLGDFRAGLQKQNADVIGFHVLNFCGHRKAPFRECV